MQIILELQNLLCRLDQSNFGLVIMFLFGFIVFSLYNKLTDTISDQEKARKYRKSIKYLNKYQKENEEFFFGAAEDEANFD